MSEFNTIGATALQTAAALAPTLAASDPKVAAILATATIANNLIQAATAATQAGLLPPDQLAAMYASIGSSIQSTHSQWQMLNAAQSMAEAKVATEPLQPPFTPAAGYAHAG